MTSSVDEAAHVPVELPRRHARLTGTACGERGPVAFPALPLAGSRAGTVAILISVVARHLIYPAYSYNRDEPVYLWMADHLRAGIFMPTDGGFPQAFHPWLAASRNGVFFSHFTIGWPAVLVASEVIFGSPDAAPALGALLVVLGT